MSYDLLQGTTSSKNWVWGARPSTATTLGALPPGATGYGPTHWITAAEAEKLVLGFMQTGGTFGCKLPREAAERKTLAYLKKTETGIMTGTVGSWVLPEKEQKRIFNKIDEVRFDLRTVGRHAAIGLGCLAAAVGLASVASVYRTSTIERRGR